MMANWDTTCENAPEWLGRREDAPSCPHWVLTLVWSGAEPARAGQTAWISEQSGTVVLGRGGGSPSEVEERIGFVRERPGQLIPTAPLAGEGLSRRQCVITTRGDSLWIKNEGRAPMYIRGTAKTEAQLFDGQWFTIKDQLIVYCNKRCSLPNLQYWSKNWAFAWGEPDEFGIVGESAKVWELREKLAFAAQSNRHVLILGASGTGKELSARAIHRMSERSNRAFISRNAATFPASLIDAELFGNAANYPNAGMPMRVGVIGQADQSTLFLDEIGELPLELQSHLLRVLDDGGEYQRLGDPQSRNSDFRLIGATNRDPSELRQDLRARLPVLVHLPTLAERITDVPLLLRHLLQRASLQSPGLRAQYFTETEEGAYPRIAPELIEHFLDRNWPLNIRELESVVWEAIANSPSRYVAMPKPVRSDNSTKASASRSIESPEPSVSDISTALRDCGNNVTRAAARLGLSSRYALYRLLKKHKIASVADDSVETTDE